MSDYQVISSENIDEILCDQFNYFQEELEVMDKNQFNLILIIKCQKHKIMLGLQKKTDSLIFSLGPHKIRTQFQDNSK
jgi:hypothetical protein